MTTYGAQMDWKWTGSDQKCPSILPSVRPSIPNTSLTYLTNLMRGIYKHSALPPCDFLDLNFVCENSDPKINFIYVIPIT